MTVVWTEQAIDQLADIINRKFSKEKAAKFADDVLKRTSGLSQFPEKGRIVPEYNTPNLRELVYKNNRIIYKIEKKIFILAVISSIYKLPDID